MKRLATASAAAALVLLTACTTTSPDVVSRYEAQRLSRVTDATLLSVRPVQVEGTQSGLGIGSGAIAGGVAGSAIGGGRGSVITGLLGAVVGGIVGNSVERGSTQENAVEILVQLRNGERRSVVQAAGAEQWMVGEPVVLITTGNKTKVVRAPQAYSAPAAYPGPQSYQPPAGYGTPQRLPAYPSAGPVPPRT